MRYASVRPALDPLLPLVEKPGRYVGIERNVTRKDLSAASVTLALAFPDTYEIGMSHTGLKILYEIVNRRAEFACERVYAPWTDLEARMREKGVPLFSTESFAPAADFAVLGFSLQAELNYSNVVNMLDLAGLPVWQCDRQEADPIVLGGGPCTANPEPLADFFDAFLVGDAEEALPRMLDAYRDARARGLSRRELLAELAAIEGIYVPSFYDVAYGEDGRITAISRNDPRAPERAKRTWVPVLKPDYYPEKPMVPSVEIVQDRLGGRDGVNRALPVLLVMARPLRMEAEAAVLTSSRGSEIVRLGGLDRRRLAPAGAVSSSGMAVGGGSEGRSGDTCPSLRRPETRRSLRCSLRFSRRFETAVSQTDLFTLFRGA